MNGSEKTSKFRKYVPKYGIKNSDDRSAFGKYVPAFVFIVFIFGMAIWFILSPKNDYSSSEKRYLQKFPEASFENIENGNFGNEFESYFADHFPVRNLWVGFNAYYALSIGNNGAGGVYNCGDGYLINKPVSTNNKLSINIKAVADFKSQSTCP